MHLHNNKYRIIFILCLLFYCSAFSQIQPIGQWREHLNWQQAIAVTKGDKLYCATKQAVFSIEDNEVERYSKTTGLTEVGVSCIGWDATTQQLVIAYNNSNIDVLKNSIVKNVGDVYHSTITGNKNINSIFCSNGFSYLCSGLGVIVVNLSKYEIKDTYFIGNNGNQLNVTSLTKDDNFWYAATSEGIKKASINSNLANANNWQSISINGLYNNAPVKEAVNAVDNIFINKNDSVFKLVNNNFSFWYAENGWQILSVTSSQNKVLACLRKPSGESKVLQLNVNASIEKTYAAAGVISYPLSAVLDGNDCWVADLFGGLSKNATEKFIPNGPLGTADAQMLVANNILYAAAGSVNTNWNYQFNRNGVYFFEEDEWSYKGYYNTPVLDSVLDFISLAYQPSTKSLWAGSFGGGLVNFANNTVSIYKQNNSTIQAAVGDANSYRVSGLAFDNNSNLWISNYGAVQPLQVRKSNGSFKSFSIPFTLTENAVAQIVVDNDNQLWIASPKGNGLICYNYGNNIDAVTDDNWKLFKQGLINGNLPSNNVNCLAKDANGLIWVGTDNGVAVMACSNVFSNNCVAFLPIVKADAFAGYLFQNQTIQNIAVDGANQKWIATKNGVWLISADGDKIILHFTASNSALLDDDVKSIAINQQTGEVFFATVKGICSYRAIATDAVENTESILIFPNPVPPNYKGQIGFKNLPQNAIVKIAELNGKLVHQTKALGGQAAWNGLNYLGQRINSGVYLVLIKTVEGKENIVGKLVVVQ